MILVSLFDSKAETWSNPHVCQNKAVAIREFAALCNDDRGTIVSSNPADFDIFVVGEFEEPFKGIIKSLDAPLHLANGKDVVKK